MTIQEQYHLAARQKENLRLGLHEDEGPPAPTSADHRLIAEVKQALSMLEPRPSPNGIGFYAWSPDTVARKIREAALLESCRYCGSIYVSGENGPTCSCPENDR